MTKTPNNSRNSNAVYRTDYTPPTYLVEQVELGFDLDADNTLVSAHLVMRRNPLVPAAALQLFGTDLELVSLRMNGKSLRARRDYVLSEGALDIPHAPDAVELEIVTRIHPARNTSLMGVYVSNGNFFSQCEAQGFRKITYFPDRPDVMAPYTVMLRGDKAKYPVLLSNGNLIEQGDLGDGRHYAKWQDPFNKPSYLFALVAGNLVCQEERFKLQSGRKVLLQVWVEPGNLDKTDHAMQSLKKSIRWDEQRFGLELDLERFMIVAVGDFNMGAMENKGLNIFNTKYVLANPRIATDSDYDNIESVIGHEYFHNWTGNRVTCRDWFQLSLKEGLTVFRDQEFSADMVGTDTGRAMKRIDDVRGLRQVQFAEDSGPMAHPVRPDSYVAIDNFYTATVYEKGAEVVRMYQTLLGRDGFRKGMDLYFARHDGQAVTCDDFRAAMADANGHDLRQFERWYSQAGTPQVHVKTTYDPAANSYDVTLTQNLRNKADMPLHIPFALGLLDAQGAEMPLYLAGKKQTETTCVLELTQTQQTFRFTQVMHRPTPSLLRNFSAPVVLDYAYRDDELLHLLKHDRDPFNRWEAGQRLAQQRLLGLVAQVQAGAALVLDALFIDALRSTLLDETLAPGLREQVLSLPTESVLAEQCKIIDPHAIHHARQFMRRTLAQSLRAEWIATYEENLTPGTYRPDAQSAGKRALKNLCLSYLLEWDDESTVQLALAQEATANNMTDRQAALAVLVQRDPHTPALQRFYADFGDEPLAVDKWFSLQATARRNDVRAMRRLLRHPAFTLNNPNRARSLIFSFCNANPAQFHAQDGSGYAFWAEQVIALNKINPQVAARLVRSLDHWKKYPPQLRDQMQAALQRVAQEKRLSKDVLELVQKALG
ncbi:aminopeptidase N [Ferrigenium sp. UT5]|uniref:aminopeptidase N n=1 Tax=Ferrigenium sp. UT5 TaxID=3242105 RepID=UPI00354AE70F